MTSSKNLDYNKTSFLNKSNSTFIEQMYLKFINKESDLPESWKNYFLDVGEEIDLVIKEINGPTWSPNKKKLSFEDLQKKIDINDQNISKLKEHQFVDNIDIKKKIDINDQNISKLKEHQFVDNINIKKTNRDSIRAVSLIRSYRQRGHLISKVDPLELREIEYLDELHPESYGFNKEDYKSKIYLDGITNKDYSNIKELLSFLKQTYCGPIGYEYMHISNPTERKWIRDRIEKDENSLQFTQNGKNAILNKLIQAEGFEKF